MNLNALLTEQAKIVTGLAPITPSTSTPDYVSMKYYEKLTVIIAVDNGNTVTGSAITLKQATSVGAGSEKALAFSTVYRNIDTGAADALAAAAVTSDTFTTDTTNAKNLLYVIEVDAADLDTDNGFDCVRLGTGDGANMVLAAVYVLWGPKYSTTPSAIVD
jgi:hypothetical protein